jgi:signal peptidase I
MIQTPENLNQNEQKGDAYGEKKQGFLIALWLFVWDFLKVFLIALAIIIPVRFYLFQPFIVTGQSMQPNIRDGEYLIIDEISYRFGDPNRGDVVVIRSPQDPSQFLIKRVIGLPNETLDISRGRVVVKNSQHPQGTTLQESYLPNNASTFGSISITLPEGQYYVLGDNRLASSDSRVFGPITKQQIVGRAFLRAFPLSRLNAFSAPQYQF